MAVLAAGCLILGILGLGAGVPEVRPGIPWRSTFWPISAEDGMRRAMPWERIRKGQLDVHFLMLAVAAGAALIGAWREGALLLFLLGLRGHGTFRHGPHQEGDRRPLPWRAKDRPGVEGWKGRADSRRRLTPGMNCPRHDGRAIPADLEVIRRRVPATNRT